jgi:hypothetical protein
VHPERAAAYIELRRLFPGAGAIAYIPPESAWRIAAFSLTRGLDSYLDRTAKIGQFAEALSGHCTNGPKLWAQIRQPLGHS